METFLTLQEVCKHLRVSETWLYRKVRAQIIPHVKIGGVVRFSERAIDKWIQDHSVKGCQKI